MHPPVLALTTEDLLLIKKEYKHFTAKVLENYEYYILLFIEGSYFSFFLSDTVALFFQSLLPLLSRFSRV